MSRFTILLLPVVACALLGCGRKTADDYVRSAEKQIAERNFRGAEVELLNALKLAPDSGSAHRLRGENRLTMGQLGAAEADLRRAMQLQESPESTLPALARAMTLQGKWSNLLSEFGAQPPLASPQAEADFRAAVGDAHLAAREVDQARKAYQSTLALSPLHVQARLGMARAAGASGEFDPAFAMVDAVIADTPNSAEAHFVRAMLSSLRHDREGMQRALERALSTSVDHVKSRIELASLLIDGKQYDQAAPLLSDAFLASAGGDARLVYLRALLDARRGNLGDARKRVADVLARLPGHAPANALAGEIEVRSKNFAKAEAHLRSALTADRSNRAARLWLASLLIQQAAPAKAIATLQPLLASGSNPDSGVLMLAAEAHLLGGDLTRAAALFEAAKSGGPGDAPALMRLGQIALTRGEFEVGAGALQEATARDPHFVQADAELVALHLYRNDPKSALRAAEAFKAKTPKNWLAHALAGRAQMSAGDLPAARREFDAALTLQSDAPAALSGLAEIDLAEGKADAAVQRYEARVSARPDEHLFLALAQLHRRASGSADAADAALRKGMAALPKSATLNAALIALQLERRDTQAALGVARQFAAANAAEPAALEALADTQFAAGRVDESAATLATLADLEPQSPRPLQRLAGQQLADNKPADAIATLKRAQRVAPNDLSVLADLAVAQIRTGAFERAMESARTIRTRAPSRAAGWVLQGDALAAQRNTAAAEGALRSALKVEPRHTPAALKLCALLTQTKRVGECTELSTRWLTANPGDVAMRMYVGDDAAARGRFSDAARQYEAVAAREPTHALALNNLAWSLGELRDARAIGYAQRAARLAPYNPDVINTLGVLQLNLGDPAKGLESLAAARTLAPGRTDLRLHLAKGLLKVDRLDEARVELVALAAEPGDSRGKEEATSLLKRLPARH